MNPKEYDLQLKEQGFDTISRIKLLREKYNISLGEAKQIVDTHIPLHDELINCLEEGEDD